MRLDRLEIKNFKGIESQEFNFSGKDACIYGENGAGKSTIGHAFQWLMTGLDPEGKKTSVVPIGGPVYGIEERPPISVMAYFTDGTNLGREQHENWSKTRGSLKKTLKGNTESFIIDGVPTTSASKFKAHVAELIGDQKTYNMLSMPLYLSEIMPWKERRGILMGLVATPNHEELLTEEFDDIRVDVLAHSILGLREMLNFRFKNEKKNLDSFPARISEVSRLIKHNLEGNKEEADTDLKKIIEKGGKLKAQIAALNSIPGKLADAVKEQGLLKKNVVLFLEGWKLSREKELFSLGTKKNTPSQRMLAIGIVEEVNINCPTCNQVLPVTEIDRLKKINDDLVIEKVECFAAVELIDREIKAIAKKEFLPPVEGEKQIKFLQGEIERLRTHDDIYVLKELEEEVKQAKTEYQEKVSEIKAHTENKLHNARIGELKAEEKKAYSQAEDTQVLIEVLKSYEVKVFNSIEEEIVEKLGVEKLSVKLMNHRYNGESTPMCEFLYKGIEFQRVNTSDKIRIGIAIASSLCNFFGKEVPIFIDNSEACNWLPKVSSQVISLKVTGDKGLNLDVSA